MNPFECHKVYEVTKKFKEKVLFPTYHINEEFAENITKIYNLSVYLGEKQN